MLIGARVGMGIGGALIWPAVLGMTYAALPRQQAALAGGLILGVAGIGNAVGPLLGGALTELISWRAIFWLNVPIAAIAVVGHRREDPPEGGSAAGADRLARAWRRSRSACCCCLLALDQASDWGFGDPRIIAMFAGSVVFIGLFAVIEPRLGERALVPDGDAQPRASAPPASPRC